MVVGDTIIHSNGLSGFTFVPAASVEIMILNIYTNNVNGHYGLTNGVDNLKVYATNGAANQILSAAVTKMGITNTFYWNQVTNTNTETGFSGIQLK
jgi:hypothetical protein